MPPSEAVAAIKNKLEVERAKLLESFKGLPVDVMTHPYEGGWSIRDVLAHVAMAEGVNVKFAKLILAKETPVQLQELAGEYPDYPLPFELDKFNAWMTERWSKRSLVEIVDALHAARKDTLLWLDSLTPEQLERKGQHAVWGDQSIHGMLRILVIHDKFHRGDIEKRKK
jgi:hypothetical protein